MSNVKTIMAIFHSVAGLIKKTLYKIMSQYFPELYEPFEGDINVKIDLTNYATKTGLKKSTGVDVFRLAAKSDLASLKAEIDKIDVVKLNTAPANLGKLSYVVNIAVAMKIVHNKLVAKVSNTDTCGFILKTKYDI